MTRRSGIVLILVSGIVTVMALLGAMFVRAAGLSSVIGKSWNAHVGADLVAENGLHYAAARLLGETGYPAFNRTVATRGDDWTFRDNRTRDVASAENPSYSHGENWTDDAALAMNGADDDDDGQVDEPDEIIGAYTPGGSEWSATDDRDGNGRFSAWSGRLRGTTGFSRTFSLKITVASVLYPVNHGTPAIPGMDFATTAYGNGLKRLGDNLGAILLTPANGVAVPHDAIGRWDVPGAGGMGEPIASSDLGTHLVDYRPPNGYATIQQVDATLSVLGYTQTERNLILPFIGLERNHVLGPVGRPRDPADQDPGIYPAPQIFLAGAPRELLEATWLYAAMRPSPLVRRIPGLVSGGAAPVYPRMMALSYVSAGDNAAVDKVMIYPNEARRLAEWAIGFRQQADRHSWRAFRESLFTRARPDHNDPLFLVPGPGNDDLDPLLAGGFSDGAYAWARAKAEVAFAAATWDVPGPNSTCGNWSSGGVSWGPALPPEFPPVVRPFFGTIGQSAYAIYGTGLIGIMKPATSSTATAWPATDPGKIFPYVWRTNETDFSGRHFAQIPLSLAPPDTFRVESLGRSEGGTALAHGSLETTRRLEFFSQEDFENLTSWTITGGAPWVWQGHDITVTEPDPADVEGARRPLVAYGGRTHPGVLTAPDYPDRWLDLAYVIDLGWMTLDMDKYTDDQVRGAIGLADRESGPLGAYPAGAYQYFPFSGDWTTRPGAEGAPEAEFTSEAQGTYVTNGAPVLPFSIPVDPQYFTSHAWGATLSHFYPPDAPAGPLLNWVPPSSPASAVSDFSVEFWDLSRNGDTNLGAQTVLNIQGPEGNSLNAQRISVTRDYAYQSIDLGSGPVQVPGILYTAYFGADPSNNTNQYHYMGGGPGGGSWMADNFNLKYDLQATAFLPEYLAHEQNHVVIVLRHDNIWGHDAPLGADPEYKGLPPPPAAPKPLIPGELDPGGLLDGNESFVLRLYVNGLYSAYPDKDGFMHPASTLWRDFTPEYNLPNIRRCYSNVNHRPKRFPANSTNSGYPAVAIRGDELRFFDRVLPLASGDPSNPGIQELYRMGRYVVPDAVVGQTLFRSPVYTFNKGARKLLYGNGTMVPGGRDLLGNERVGTRMRVQPCTSAGIPVGLPVEDETGAFLDLRGLGQVDSFQYEVEFFNKSSNLDPLYETPLFESLWITFKEPGVRWSSWE